MICFPFWGSQNWNGRPRLFSKFMIFVTELEASPHSACIIAEGHKKKSSACDPSPYLEHTTPGSLCCLPNKALWALAARCNLIQWQTHTHTRQDKHTSHTLPWLLPAIQLQLQQRLGLLWIALQAPHAGRHSQDDVPQTQAVPNTSPHYCLQQTSLKTAIFHGSQLSTTSRRSHFPAPCGWYVSVLSGSL